MKTLNLQKKGRLGEDIAVKYLLEHGFTIIARNLYLGKSEIDIIAKKTECIYFIEVKSSFDSASVAPFDRINTSKLKSLYRGLAKWCALNHWSGDTEVMCLGVWVDQLQKRARVESFIVGV